MAVNVMEELVHLGLVPFVIAIDTAGVTIGFTVMVILLELTRFGMAHVAVEVNVQLTT